MDDKAVTYTTVSGSGGMPPPGDRVIGERELRKLAAAAVDAELAWASHWLHLREIAPAMDYMMGLKAGA